ncbi:Bestrophin, RFP-TM, chloride channel-domain-containing protein [Ephemerocybe angulata]|uniref:Bestrophin, RFP-TM, chloride channel-domain-containing protein n=1 Tax=Ephemerocybe angulata TaxID=980116 RepID=A0A8H6MDW1_9AGAR|nr:Bestrophin, RFP-TM, chloride channel-domain-containing protein [Tulosesus angulatus]
MASHEVPHSPAPPSAASVHRTDTLTHTGFRVPDPFAPRRRPGSSFVHALLATALFRCWHILLFFTAWGTAVTVLNDQGKKITLEPTLLTVAGTVLGFVISYRTTSSFERYNEGRRLWSQIILNSRTFSRLVWFHVPNSIGETPEETDELKAKALVEKKTVINLLEAFAVAVKHYLRGEDGIYYKDLYYLVKFLPAYALPTGMPSQTDLTSIEIEPSSPVSSSHNDAEKGEAEDDNDLHDLGLTRSGTRSGASDHNNSQMLHRLQTNGPRVKLPDVATSPTKSARASGRRTSFSVSLISPRSNKSHVYETQRTVVPAAEEAYLYPSSMPPRYTIFDLFPFSLLIGLVTKRGHEVKGKKAARIRAKMRQKTISHNLPLEISLYLSSYIASLQARKICDVPTTNALFATLNTLVESLTGLERILTTPVPFSYSIHLWVVTIIYCLALPLQIWKTMHWMTIPATAVISFIFFGFLVAGEEIENPFGYDKNDLNLDHFTQNIIRSELKAVTSAPPPDPARWAFGAENNLLFAADLNDRVPPQQWVERGYHDILTALSRT